MTKLKTIPITVIITILAALVAIIVFAWSGLYPVSASSDHIKPVGWLLETAREHSVALRASELVPPGDLHLSERVAIGAGHYREMCVGCHGAPGVEPSQKFNPPPPALFRREVEPRRAFWTIKHGLKMTAMPSHLDHSDTDNWNTVAFVQALTNMTAEEYDRLTRRATHEHSDGLEHDHGGETYNTNTDHTDNDRDEKNVGSSAKSVGKFRFR